MKEFLEEYIKPLEGDVVLEETGEKVGKHEGACYYTIGQRHGFSITVGEGPYYVTRKDVKTNMLYVSKSKMMNNECAITDVNWIAEKPELPLKVQVKIRYRTASIPAIVNENSIRFEKPAEAVTPGQSAVFYRGEEVLGGGILA